MTDLYIITNLFDIFLLPCIFSQKPQRLVSSPSQKSQRDKELSTEFKRYLHLRQITEYSTYGSLTYGFEILYFVVPSMELPSVACGNLKDFAFEYSLIFSIYTLLPIFGQDWPSGCVIAIKMEQISNICNKYTFLVKNATQQDIFAIRVSFQRVEITFGCLRLQGLSF